MAKVGGSMSIWDEIPGFTVFFEGFPYWRYTDCVTIGNLSNTLIDGVKMCHVIIFIGKAP